MRVYDSVIQVIGRTPLLRLHKVTRGIRCHLLAKVEGLNPGGSVKDRIGIRMIEDAERRGLLKPGGTIIENTSGNTGIGLALAAAVKGYRCVFTLNDKQSQEKVDLLKAFGADVIVCPTAVSPDDPRSYTSVARRLARETPNSYFSNQYDNPENPAAHEATTGPEIWEDTDGEVDVFVAGMGTGGTITGIGRYLKERKPSVRIVGVDPVGSIFHQFFHTGKPGEARVYKTEGIGEDFFPRALDFSILDDVVQVNDREAFLMARRLTREEGIFAGGSSGSALFGALRVARDLPPEATVVVLLPERGERNLGKIYNDAWMRENQFLDSSPSLTAEDLLGRKRAGVTNLVSVSPETPLQDAIRTMKEKEISQLPVVDAAGEMVGSVREDQMIDILVHGGDIRHLKVGEVMEEPFPRVEAAASAQEIQRLLAAGHPAVLVTGEGGRTGIVTKFDLIHTLAT